jgi:hypothetical protein
LERSAITAIFVQGIALELMASIRQDQSRRGAPGMSLSLTPAAHAALEHLFEETLREYDRIIYDLARRHHYRLPPATRIRQMIADHGGVGTAKRLMRTPKTQSGFTELWMFGRKIGMDLISKYSVEAAMLEERFGRLFDDDELAEARRRLDEINRPAAATAEPDE